MLETFRENVQNVQGKSSKSPMEIFKISQVNIQYVPKNVQNVAGKCSKCPWKMFKISLENVLNVPLNVQKVLGKRSKSLLEVCTTHLLAGLIWQHIR